MRSFARAYGQRKAATAPAGATLEAPLMSSATRHSEVERQSAVMKAPPGFDWRRPENWHLADYIEAAREPADIAVETAAQARLVEEFRNQIHPGREIRKQMTCDRGTARAALAPLNLVIRDPENLSVRSKRWNGRLSPCHVSAWRCFRPQQFSASFFVTAERNHAAHFFAWLLCLDFFVTFTVRFL